MQPLIIFLFGSLSLFSVAWAKEEKKPLNRLDAIEVEAVETAHALRSHEVSVAAGILPMDPYYVGFSFGGGYTYYLNDTIGWEVVNASYTFSVQKDLTTKLAEQGIRPETVERLQSLVASSFVFVPYYGKSVFLKEYLQRTRTSVFIGPGFASTNLGSGVSAQVGLRMDTFVRDNLTWRLELREHLTIDGGKSFFAFNLGTNWMF